MGSSGEPGNVRLLFPWDDNDGLTATLRDPRLWAAAFETQPQRKLIKTAAKKVLNVKGVPHTDSEQLGALTVKLLETRQGRAALYHEFEKITPIPETYLAARLHREVVR